MIKSEKLFKAVKIAVKVGMFEKYNSLEEYEKRHKQMEEFLELMETDNA